MPARAPGGMFFERYSKRRLARRKEGSVVDQAGQQAARRIDSSEVDHARAAAENEGRNCSLPQKRSQKRGPKLTAASTLQLVSYETIATVSC